MYESKDSFGADGVVFSFEEKLLTLYRFQIKLGKSSLNNDKKSNPFQEIGTKFNTHKPRVFEIYRTLFPGLTVEERRFLITTRSYSPKEGDDFTKQYNCEIIGAAKLTEFVWPACVKALGVPYS